MKFHSQIEKSKQSDVGYTLNKSIIDHMANHREDNNHSHLRAIKARLGDPGKMV